MTLKAAAAGLDLGGGKGVICAPADGLDGELRRAALLDFADLVDSLDGRYITAEDVGTSPDDLVTIAERTGHVTGLPADRGGSGDPSPFTALGVEAAIRACAASVFGEPDLSGLRVAIVGLGHVGASLARLLSKDGCDLIVSDIDGRKHRIAAELGAEWVEPARAEEVECDVLAPCALGGVVTSSNVEALRCRILCGSANNQLTSDDLADELLARGILYAPDFIANAGGLINVYRELRGYDEQRATALAHGIEGTLAQVLEAAAAHCVSPLVAARELAAGRLASVAH
jgi:leucine dehydrogenase